MSSQPVKLPPESFGKFAARVAARVGRAALNVGERVYAAAFALLILWVSWNAFSYLLESLLRPAPAPKAVTQFPKRLDESLLHGSRPDWVGLQATENPRTPPSHYHRFDNWIQADKFNDCARSGCHAPLPHAKRKEVRAFLNMHATTMHCGVCHFESEAQPLPLTWYDLQTGKACEPPPLLEALAFLLKAEERPQGQAPPIASLNIEQQREIVTLLRAAAQRADGDANLQRMAAHMAAVTPGSDQLLRLVTVARELVQKSLRGLYGAKLAIRASDGRPMLAHPGTSEAIRAYLALFRDVGEAQRKEMLARVHPLKRSTPLTCSACHREQGSQVDFSAAGYPAARITDLLSPAIFDMIDHISQGRPFYLPSFVRSPAPASQPASRPR
ncbi:hypothetical protein RAS1_05880 [Phycisphaerae bacterium RAS1]|nr:hypothetical protein RAS1_05880 [Phycisphaerae bacterium RAS1]